MEFRIKRTSGKTWAKMQDGDFLDQAFLKQVGEILLEAVVYEAGRDFAKQGNRATPAGVAEGIPGSVKFFDSFSYKIVGNRVEIWSSWPWIEQIIEGRRPYPMEWLTRQEGVSKVPMKGPRGTVLIKTTPASPRDAWIHPGFRKHNFLRRGYERARKRMDELIQKQVIKVLSGMNVA